MRGAVSIGRRLQDPLAELVKIEPQAIGVGQYQHDVDPSSLGRSLDDVVATGDRWAWMSMPRALSFWPGSPAWGQLARQW